MSREVSGTTCVVLAGGLGTRLRSEIADLPKCLAPVGDRSFLALQLDGLVDLGVDRIVLSLGYLSEKVIAAIADLTCPVPLSYVVEKEPLGTGGAIAHVFASLGIDEAMVVNGDTYLEGDAAAMLSPLDRGGSEWLRMAVVDVPDRTRFGGVDVAASGAVVGFFEKGRAGPGLINAGMYRLSLSALLTGPAGRFSLEADLLPSLTAARHVTAAALQGEFIDIGVPEDYRRFCARHG